MKSALQLIDNLNGASRLDPTQARRSRDEVLHEIFEAQADARPEAAGSRDAGDGARGAGPLAAPHRPRGNRALVRADAGSLCHVTLPTSQFKKIAPIGELAEQLLAPVPGLCFCCKVASDNAEGVRST
jgi:hypothetical protein